MRSPSNTSLSRLGLTLALSALGASGIPAQAPADAVPSAQIVSPERDSYMTGMVLLRADADSSSSVQNVTFYVDGRQVCMLIQRPFECEWDAGSEVAAHQVRAVFALPDGKRVARTVRTKGLGFADRVNVEV